MNTLVESNGHISTTIELATATQSRTHKYTIRTYRHSIVFDLDVESDNLFVYMRRKRIKHSSRAFDTCHTTCSFINSDSIIKLEFARTRCTSSAISASGCWRTGVSDSARPTQMLQNSFSIIFPFCALLGDRLRETSHFARLAEAVNCTESKKKMLQNEMYYILAHAPSKAAAPTLSTLFRAHTHTRTRCMR